MLSKTCLLILFHREENECFACKLHVLKAIFITVIHNNLLMFETNAELLNFSLYTAFKILLIYRKIVLYLLHGPNNYNDTKPWMSSLLVFNRVYRLEIQPVMSVFFDPSCELAPL